MTHARSRTGPDRSTPLGAMRATWICVALTAIVVAVYAPVRAFEFVTWDDNSHVYENPHVKAGLTWDGVRWAFTTGATGNWHPLTWLSHMLDVQLFGIDAGLHHVTSVFLHVVNTLLVFGVLHRMTGAPGRSAAVAALFGVHPMHVESVAWVSERKDVLSTLFWALTLWAYVDYVRRPATRRYLTVLACFALGLMAKPMLVTLPFLLLGLDWWPLRRVDRLRAAWPLVREKLALFALAAGSCIVTFLVQRQAGAVGSDEAFPIARRIAGALESYAAYIGNTLWPTRLAALYPYESASRSAWWTAGAAILLAGSSAVAVRQAGRRPYLIVGWLWFLGTLVPVIGLIQAGSQSMADRYGYVPLIGLFLIAAWGLADLTANWANRTTVGSAVAALTVAACAVLARRQVETWRDSVALWNQAIAVTEDNAVAHTNLGYALLSSGSLDDAVIHLSEAIRIEPGNALAHNDLGLAFARRGAMEQAEAQFAQAVRIAPGYAEAHNNLGAALEQRGRLDDAIVEATTAVRLDPAAAQWHFTLGRMHGTKGDTARALAEFRTALTIDPGHIAARRAFIALGGEPDIRR